MFTIPNFISVVRIIIAFMFPWLFDQQRILSLVLLILSGISDVADGFIARKYNQVSEIGKILDPIADKLTQFMIIHTFCIKGFLPVIFLIVFAAIQVGMIILTSVFVKLGNKPFSSKWYGKLASFLFFLFAVLSIAYKIFNTSFGLEEFVLRALFVVVMFFFIYAFIGYISMAIKANKKRKTHN